MNITAQEGDIILVAGAGLGQEAILINKEFQLKTVGVDINIEQMTCRLKVKNCAPKAGYNFIGFCR